MMTLIEEMYGQLNGGEIILWCEGRSGDKQTNTRRKREREETLTQCQEREEEVEETFEKLREKYASTDKYNTPQLCLWSRIIISSQHESYIASYFC